MTHITPNQPILIVVGPSATGKTSAIEILHNKGIIEVTPTWTTRPRRSDEDKRTVEHRFVDNEKFDDLLEEGFFLETSTMFGLDYRYGLPKVAIPYEAHSVPTIMLRSSLLDRAYVYFKNNKVYHIEDSFDHVYERLQARKAEGEKLGTRLQDYQKEVKDGRRLADRVFINRGIEDMVEEIEQAIKEDFDG